MSEKVRLKKVELLSDNWYILKKYVFDYQMPNGDWEEQKREAYDRGNGAAILLYEPQRAKVILTRQFRLPTFISGNADGMMIEVCAGLLDESAPEDCIRRETEEETGYRVGKVQKVMEAYMSPGAVTEILYFFVGEYSAEMRVSAGGGLAEEQEHIEVLELDFERAYGMIASGEIIDAKTIMLLQYAKLHQLV